MEKIEEEKNKKTRLLVTAFKLFTEKGLKDTSIQDIVDNADVGKGTFYLYFKDKYEIRDILIIKKSQILFNNALKALRRKKEINKLDDQIIFIVDHVINALKRNPILLKFISKNLSWGAYSQTVNKVYEDTENNEDGIYQLFLKGIETNIKLKNPEVTLFMIIELVSATCFNSILYKEPLPIEEYKPFLYETIRKLIKE